MLRLLIDTLLFRKRCGNCHWHSPVSRTCMRNAFNSKRETVYHPYCRGCRNHSWVWRWW